MLFEGFFTTAIAVKGSKAAVMANLPHVKTASELRKRSDAEYLSLLMRRVFRAGLRHSMVDAKWAHFEKVFFGFDPQKMLFLDDDFFQRCMQDTGLIRHARKLKAISVNAQMLCDIAQEHGSFAEFIASYDSAEIVHLWMRLKKQGAQMGGASAPAFLRLAGKDTFTFSQDVVAALQSRQLIDRLPSSKRDLILVQSLFNQWHEETGLAYSALSRIISRTVN